MRANKSALSSKIIRHRNRHRPELGDAAGLESSRYRLDAADAHSNAALQPRRSVDPQRRSEGGLDVEFRKALTEPCPIPMRKRAKGITYISGSRIFSALEDPGDVFSRADIGQQLVEPRRRAL